MWLLPTSEANGRALSPLERLFLDLWYGLTHVQALDAHRVQCMNSRTLVRELHEELGIDRIEKTDLERLVAETTLALDRDPVIRTHFGASHAILKPLLPSAPKLFAQSKPAKDQTADSGQTAARELRFALSDLNAALEKTYLDRLATSLVEALTNAREDDIDLLTNALLSDLIDRGRSLESLFASIGHFLVPNEYTFLENLQFLLKQFRRERQEFEVTLRLFGGRRLTRLGDFGPFQISTTASRVTPWDPRSTTFAKPGPNVWFTSGCFEEEDFLAAAVQARESFERLLDLSRFEFENNSISVDDRCCVRRTNDDQSELLEVKSIVPNPSRRVGANEFQEFCRRFDRVDRSEYLSSAARTLLRAGFRQYRYGRDSQNYADKLLNWWMGLEAMANFGPDRIGGNVARNISVAVAIGDAQLHIRDYLATLRHLKPELPGSLRQLTGASSITDVTPEGLIKCLQDQTCAADLFAAIPCSLLAQRRGRELAAWFADPKKAADRLEEHHQRIRSHLDRLYRIRCCIVHGSPVRFRLALFAASLEHYLKKTLLLALNAFDDHRHILDLKELFDRCDSTHRRLLASLRLDNANRDTIRNAILCDVVTQD